MYIITYDIQKKENDIKSYASTRKSKTSFGKKFKHTDQCTAVRNLNKLMEGTIAARAISEKNSIGSSDLSTVKVTPQMMAKVNSGDKLRARPGKKGHK